MILARLVYDQPTNTFTAIGWVKYYMESQRLYNVSAYIEPDDRVELFFNKDYAILFKQCRLQNNNQ
ncbi:hypothetical protein RCS94_10905 [Orbaceae bacterium ac157xtp]